MASLNSVVIARLASAVYGLQLGQATMREAIEAANVLGGGDAGVAALMQMLYGRDFAGVSNAQLAAKIVSNVGITDPALVTEATTVVTNLLDASAPGSVGQTLVNIVNSFALLTADPAYGDYARAFNLQVGRAIDYANTLGTPDVMVSAVTPVFNLAPGSAAGIPVMQLTGNMDVRIDFTNPNNQVTGLDLNGNGVIEPDGVENAQKGIAANFQGVDAYPRNPLNERDSANNFLGDIFFDGTGFKADGVNTNGTIFLGGLGADIALGGIGNDFLAGGGVGEKAGGWRDELRGGRNADVFFVELSRLSNTDGNNIVIDGGNTADDIIPGDPAAVRGLGTQDNDTLLLEASDDDEPVTVNLAGQSVSTASGAGTSNLVNVESVNASGNLYGFLDKVDVVIGSRAYDGYGDAHTVGTPNYGRGSTAQLILLGDANNNALIGGYDNDKINGNAGDDLLMGGDLRFLITHKNNPNLLDSNGGLALNKTAQGLVNDGKDSISGGAGNDNIVFESDNGSINGDGDTATTSGTKVDGTITRDYVGPRMSSSGDALWITDFSMGRVYGATLADEATAQQTAMGKLTTDSTYRIDLGGGNNFRNYGGAVTSSQDTTNYVGTASRVAVSNMESVNATGLGAIDYKLAGSNSPETVFNNQQNYFGFTGGNLDLRGNGVDNVLLASTGNDVLEGRGGDDVLSGGAGNDRFIVSFGDGIDWVARPVDANGDNIWDTTGGLKVFGGLAWGQDFRAPAAPTAGRTTLVVDFGTTVLNGVDTGVVTFQVRIDGTDFGTTLSSATLFAAKSTAELAAIVNANYSAQDPNVSVVAVSPSRIEVRAIDSTPGDGKLPEIGTLPADGFFVSGTAAGVGTFQAKGSILGLSGTDLEDDVLIIKSYEDRSINLGQNEAKVEISQAAQMAAAFSATGTQLTQGQEWLLFLENVREGDTVRVTVNGHKFDYTLAAGENADVAATKLATVIASALDPHSAAGTLGATASTGTFGDPIEIALGGNSAGVSITQTVVSGASQAFMDISTTVVRADGKTPFGSTSLHNQSSTAVQMLGFDGRNGALNRQDEAASPVVLFQGRNTGDTTMSLLLTAKDAGGKLSGMDANFNPAGNGQWINGDDHLIGGLGNDQIFGGTGDDLIEMSKGVDTVDGGGNAKLNDGTTQVFTDILQAQERTFGDGTYFKVTLDPTLYTTGKGTVAAIAADGKPTGDVTTFVDIELVRVLENNRNSELDVQALSDAVAAAAASGPAGGIVAPVPGVPGEGLVVNVTNAPSIEYTIDKNANGVIDLPGETFTATAVLGTESVTTGKANDTIIVDHTHANANNRFSMGDQQNNEVTLFRGADIVQYNHTALAAAGRPTFTVAVQDLGSAAVSLTGGALGTAKFTDTLSGVEIIDVATFAGTASKGNDTIDLSALNGATVNYGPDLLVGTSLGGNVAPESTLAIKDANRLDSGAIAATKALASELMTIKGILDFERVTGSDGDDRVVVADTMGSLGTATTPIAVPSYLGKANTVSAVDNLTYRFDLGAGKNDIVDYRNESGAVSVVVNFKGTSDTVIVDGDTDNLVTTQFTDRVDLVVNTERYFASQGDSRIDLSAANQGSTIQFSAEIKLNGNEFLDPNGTSTPAVTDQVRGISLTAADGTLLRRFMNADAGDTASSPPALWTHVKGSGFAETVNFTNQENGTAETLDLGEGANVVSYGGLTQANVEITANIAAGSLKYTVTPQGGAADTITITRNVDGGLTLIATNDNDDEIVNTFAAPTKLNGAAAGYKDLTGTVGGGYHLIDLNAGVVVEDVALNFKGPYTPAAGYLNNVTKIVAFENATGGAEQDRIFGNAADNKLDGGGGNDIISGGGGADVLTGGADNDRFTYGSINDGGPFKGASALTLAAADLITDFGTGSDVLVVDAGLFGLLFQNSTGVIDAAPAVVPTNGANLDNASVFLVTAAAATLDTFADVKTAIGTLAGAHIGDGKFFGAGGANEANQMAIFFVSDGTDTGMYVYRDGDDNATVDPGELALVSVLAGQAAVVAGAGVAAGKFEDGDVVIRVGGLAGQQTFELNKLDFGRTELVYTNVNQSRIGFVDNLNGWQSTVDRFDLSALFSAQTLAQTAIAAVRNTTAAGNNTGVSVADFFNDAGVYRAVVVEEFAGGANTRVFVDVNLDGSFDIATDLVVDIAGVGLGITIDNFVFG